jgi:hypothetical protein
MFGSNKSKPQYGKVILGTIAAVLAVEGAIVAAYLLWKKYQEKKALPEGEDLGFEIDEQECLVTFENEEEEQEA